MKRSFSKIWGYFIYEKAKSLLLYTVEDLSSLQSQNYTKLQVCQLLRLLLNSIDSAVVIAKEHFFRRCTGSNRTVSVACSDQI